MHKRSVLPLLFAAAAVACLFTAMATRASAALLAYDPFSIGIGAGDYLAGDEGSGTNVLGGQNPTTGSTVFYAGPWLQQGDDSQAVKNIGSLSYPRLPRAGGQVNETLQFDCCTFGRSAREIAGGLGSGRDPRTIYQSFLIDFGSQGTDNSAEFGKRAYEMFSGGFGDAFLAVDLFVNRFAGVDQLSLAVYAPSGSQLQQLNGGGLTLEALAGTHLVVFRFDFQPADSDVVTVYLDPRDSIESNHEPAAQISVGASDLFISHHSAITNFTFSGSGHVPGSFDEIRWGETFGDVTPFLLVPEPSAAWLMLAALAVMGLVFRRRTQDGADPDCRREIQLKPAS